MQKITTLLQKTNLFFKSFSLIELLIALIILSLISSAFIPLVTKKLKASDITVGSFNNNEGITCKDGYHELNNQCALDIENCLSYDNLNKCIVCKAGYLLQDYVCYKMIDNCKTQSANTCSVCNTGYVLQNNVCYKSISNCKTQNEATCSACNSGYVLFNNTCLISNCYDFFCNFCTTSDNGSCVSCKDGYTLYNGKCYFGTLEGCSNPTYDDNYQRISCASCATGYTKCNSGSCRLTTAVNADCPSNTIKIGCTCVAQYNIGDGKYGEGISPVKTCTTGSSCSVANVNSSTLTASNLEAVCWKGTTAGTCNSNYGGYSGCTRIVCNWAGAYEMCNSIGWRLPTMPELVAFTNTTYSSKTLSSSGLMFCDNLSSSTVAPVCAILTSSACMGTRHNYCHPFYVWSSAFYSVSLSYGRNLNSGSWTSNMYYIDNAFSARCVKDL